MSNMVDEERTQETPQRGLGRRKVGAILAGGLVLGVGAAVTLAAWNDSEFASSTFTAGSFTFTGSTDGTTFAENPAAPGASLDFELSPTNLAPGDSVYAPYSLRVTGNDATVTPEAPVFTDDLTSSKLTLEVKQVGAHGCDATAFDGSAENVTATPFDIAVGSDVNLCLKATATASLAQDDTGVVTWQWDAEATSTN